MWRRRGRRGGRRGDGVLAQTQDDQTLAAVDECRQPEDAVGAERFVERAAEEIRRRHPRRPDDVVDADVFRQDVIADAVADQGFERWPGEADRRRPTDEHQEDRRQRGKERAQRQAGSHAAEAGLERREVAETLGETSALPRGEHVDQAAQRRGGEVAEVAEAETVAQQEEDVAAKVRRGEGVQPFEHEEDGFGLPGMHGAAVQTGGGASREISAMTWRYASSRRRTWTAGVGRDRLENTCEWRDTDRHVDIVKPPKPAMPDRRRKHSIGVSRERPAYASALRVTAGHAQTGPGQLL